MADTQMISRHAIRNYGSVLQTYATQVLIEGAGSGCTVIDYRQPGLSDTARGYRQKEPGMSGLAKDVAYRAFRSHGARARGALFEEFLRRRMHLTRKRYSSYDELRKETWPEDRVYCVGSDQVWNIERNMDNRPYYLSFVPEQARKFSLASSIGMEKLPKYEEDQLVEALRGFAGVSVRESSAAEYLNSLGVPAVHHLDPTLAVTKQEWSDFAAAVPKRKDPFVLVYQLNASPVLQEAALAVGRELRLPVIRMEYWRTLRGRGTRTLIRPSAEEFVAMVRDATILVSDSFHGAAFALNLGTQLVSVPPPKYGGRLESLLSRFGWSGSSAPTVAGALDIVRNQCGLPEKAELLSSDRERVRCYIRRMLDTSNSNPVGGVVA